MAMRLSFSNLLAISCAMFLLALVALGGMEFKLWSQVTYLRGSSLLELDPLGNVHFMRYALVSPIFYASDLLNLDADYIFSFLCVFFIFFIARNIFYISCYTYHLDERENQGIYFLALMFMIFLSLFMNGRLFFAMAGFSFVVLNVTKWELEKITFFRMFCFNFFGYFLCSVSTGTFMVSIIFTLAWLSLGWRRKKSIANISLYILFFACVFPIFKSYLMKNVDFYGGGIDGAFAMLNHGLGIIFYKFNDFIRYFLVVLCFLLSGVAVMLLAVASFMRVVLYACFSAVFGGFFGFSSAVVAAPVFFVALIAIMRKLKGDYRLVFNSVPLIS